jgi:hypothetical protein
LSLTFEAQKWNSLANSQPPTPTNGRIRGLNSQIPIWTGGNHMISCSMSRVSNQCGRYQRTPQNERLRFVDCQLPEGQLPTSGLGSQGGNSVLQGAFESADSLISADSRPTTNYQNVKTSPKEVRRPSRPTPGVFNRV